MFESRPALIAVSNTRVYDEGREGETRTSPGSRAGDRRFLMSGFEQDRRLDAMAPGVSLAAIVAKTVGSGCQGLSDDAVTGVLARAAACEAWLASVKLEAVLVLLRRRGIPALGARPDGLPVAWRNDLSEEVADALGISRQAADQLVDMAWSLAARLPRTAAALRAGVIDFVKA